MAEKSAAERAAARNARSGKARNFTQLGVTVERGKVYKGMGITRNELGDLKGACAGIDQAHGFLGGVTTFVLCVNGNEKRTKLLSNRKPAERDVAEFNAMADAVDD